MAGRLTVRQRINAYLDDSSVQKRGSIARRAMYDATNGIMTVLRHLVACFAAPQWIVDRPSLKGDDFTIVPGSAATSLSRGWEKRGPCKNRVIRHPAIEIGTVDDAPTPKRRR